MKAILISDPTLRDGNHAVKHQLTAENIACYAKAADVAGIDIIEVGHGCGLGGSSLQFGFSPLTYREMLNIARRSLNKSQLGVHIIPGIGRKQEVDIALEEGVDVFRVGVHCTEANVTQSLIQHVNYNQKRVFGALMMIHMVDEKKLYEEAKKMLDYGADAVILMDSAGALLPQEVEKRVSYLVENLSMQIGFHAHNNLGLAVANSLAAALAGASIIDGTARGLFC